MAYIAVPRFPKFAEAKGAGGAGVQDSCAGSEPQGDDDGVDDDDVQAGEKEYGVNASLAGPP
eukprot:2016301-Prorocentrum_lima.AAC.1